MKSLFYFLLLCTVILNCTPTAIDPPAEAEEKVCTNTVTATVQYMKVNESGTEDFYYLLLVDPESGTEQIVFPSSLSSKYHSVGTEIEVNYSPTQKIHEYIVCLAGHTIDPDNPDISTMPIIDVCSTNRVLS